MIRLLQLNAHCATFWHRSAIARLTPTFRPTERVLDECWEPMPEENSPHALPDVPDDLKPGGIRGEKIAVNRQLTVFFWRRSDQALLKLNSEHG